MALEGNSLLWLIIVHIVLTLAWKLIFKSIHVIFYILLVALLLIFFFGITWGDVATAAAVI